MIVSGARGILFNPDTVYAIESSDGKYDIIAENKDYTVTIYENLYKTNTDKVMRVISYQIVCQVLKDEDWSYSKWQLWKLLQDK